ncbi:MAG: 30S ribosomal protein S8 [Chloroflexota bacterium]|nr:30S ribosomal protein S8 [Chloroflexota bacterium]
MQTTDPIADLLTRIRNATLARHETVVMPSSRMKRNIAAILKAEGYIRDFEEVPGDGPQPNLRLALKYDRSRQPEIRGIRRVSKPGLRVYTSRDQMPRVLGGIGLAIVSTSRGVMSGRQAYRERIGGEVLCYVW